MRAHPATALIVDHLGLHQPPYLPVTDPPWRDLDRLLALAGTAPCPGQKLDSAFRQNLDDIVPGI